MILLRIAIAAFLTMLVGCRNVPVPAPAIDPGMAACIPAGTTLLAGIDLDRLRLSPFYSKLPPAALALLDSLREAHFLMLASDGRNLLSIARGPFRQLPAGATALGKALAVSGTPDFLSAATGQFSSGKPGAPGLVDSAATIVGGVQIWVMAQGGVRLPLSGNAANLNRLLRDSEYAAITANLGSSVDVALIAIGHTPEAARQVEDTLRATITLTSAAEARQPEMVALLRAIQLTRDGRTVRASVSATGDAAQKLLTLLAP